MSIVTKKSTAAKNLPTDEICEAYKQGFKVKEIAEMHNTTETSIRNHLRKGNVWPPFQQVNARKAQNIMSKMQKKPVDRGFSRRVLNYILESNEEVFTIETLAKIFNKKNSEVCAALSQLAKKNVGIERAFIGAYRRTPSAKTVVQENKVEVKNNNSAGDDFLSLMKKIVDLANECGGLGSLIARAKMLEQAGHR